MSAENCRSNCSSKQTNKQPNKSNVINKTAKDNRRIMKVASCGRRHFVAISKWMVALFLDLDGPWQAEQDTDKRRDLETKHHKFRKEKIKQYKFPVKLTKKVTFFPFIFRDEKGIFRQTCPFFSFQLWDVHFSIFEWKKKPRFAGAQGPIMPSSALCYLLNTSNEKLSLGCLTVYF